MTDKEKRDYIRAAVQVCKSICATRIDSGRHEAAYYAVGELLDLMLVEKDQKKLVKILDSAVSICEYVSEILGTDIVGFSLEGILLHGFNLLSKPQKKNKHKSGK